MVQCAAALFFMARDGTLWKLPKEWSFVDSLKASASPAAIYALQNTLLQLSYRNLDSLTFSLLNQTKLVFTAVFMFLLLGYATSSVSSLALVISRIFNAISFWHITIDCIREVDPTLLCFLLSSFSILSTQWVIYSGSNSYLKMLHRGATMVF